jgi:hypothetical protein
LKNDDPFERAARSEQEATRRLEFADSIREFTFSVVDYVNHSMRNWKEKALKGFKARLSDDSVEDEWRTLPVDDYLSPDQIKAIKHSHLDLEALRALPVDGPFTPGQIMILATNDIRALLRSVRRLPIDDALSPNQLMKLAETDVEALADAMNLAPVDGPFSPEQAVRLTKADMDRLFDHSRATSSEGPIGPSEFVKRILSDNDS